MEQSSQDDPARLAYLETRRAHWDAIAQMRDSRRGMGGAYHRRLADLYRFLVPAGQRVLEGGSGTGNLLAALQPARGVGVDFSPEMVSRATAKHPQLAFIQADAHELPTLEGPFDAIILSDLVNDAWDVQQILEGLGPYCAPHTRLILNYYSALWEMPLYASRELPTTSASSFSTLEPRGLRSKQASECPFSRISL